MLEPCLKSGLNFRPYRGNENNHPVQLREEEHYQQILIVKKQKQV